MTRSKLAIVLALALGLGAFAGWFARDLLAKPGKACRDEVVSIDGARGAVSCSHDEQSSEIVKDGYLVCRCRKGK